MKRSEDINFSPEVDNASVVYFARNEKSQLIKIGFSRSPAKRVSGLGSNIGSRVTLLFTHRGGRDEESYFHRRFRFCHEHGEWFREEGNFLAYLQKRGQDSKKLAEQREADAAKKMLLAQKASEKFAKKHGPPPPGLVGYARVSTVEQNLDMQIAMLKKEGVPDEHMFVEKLSAVNAKRPQFHLMMKFLLPGDTLLVYSVSRLARDIRTLHSICDELKKQNVTLRSITEPHMDTATPEGRLMFSVKGAIDQFEREQTIRRTRHGLDERKRQGMFLGAPRVITADRVAAMRRDLKQPKMTVQLVAKKHKVSVASVYAYLKGGKKAACK